MTDPHLDPASYGPGKSGEPILWIRSRLDVHGFGYRDQWGYADRDRVAAFQRAQGWSGADADGLPGPITLKRLALSPAPALTLPAQILDLLDWKLTLPIGSPGSPTEIKQSDLASFRDLRYFYVGSGGGVVMRANCAGVTTSGSHYPRTELREMKGSALASWSSASGSHSLALRAAITRLPEVKPHIVVAQIHDAADDIVEVRLEGKRLFAESDGEELGDLDASYLLGSRFKIAIVATSHGVTVDYINEATGTTRATPVLERTGSGWYFKAGAYVQAYAGQSFNGGTVPADAAGEVVVYDLAARHAA